MDKDISIGFAAKIKPIKPINEEMTLCKCYVLALGKNRKKTKLFKGSVEDALPTLFNIPVVGHIFVDEDGKNMGGHDIAIEQMANGKYKFKKLTVPYGTIPQQDNVHFEDVKEDDGTTKTYLVADIILWTGRYPELIETSYSDEVYYNQSMEIKPLKSTKDADGYMTIDKFRFSALCLLGKSDDSSKNYEPCFPSASVVPYEFASTDEIRYLFEEFRNKLAEDYISAYAFEKGGKSKVNFEKIQEILKTFGLEVATVEELPFAITDEMTEEEATNAIKDAFNLNSGDASTTHAGSAGADNNATGTDEAGSEGDNTGEPAPEANFQAEMTYNQLREALSEAVNKICFWENSESYENYWLNDFDDQFVYCSYSIGTKGNNVVRGNKRFEYATSNAGASIAVSTGVEIKVMWLTFEEADKLAADRAQLAELFEYKKRRDEEDKNKEYSAVIQEFSDLSEIEEYKQIVGNALEFSCSDDLKEKLYAVRGKYGKAKPVPKATKVGINFSKHTEEKSAEKAFYEKYLPV